MIDPITNMYPNLPPPMPVPGPGEPGYQGEIRQGANWWDNLKSDVRSVIKHPMKSMRTFLEQGQIPYNFDKGVEAGNVESMPLDFAVDMINIPGTALKLKENLNEGNYGSAGLQALSFLPIAKVGTKIGLNPKTAEIASKFSKYGAKGTGAAMAYNTGGTTDPKKSAPMVAAMSPDMIRQMSILYPDMATDFSNMSFEDLSGLYNAMQEGTRNEQQRLNDFQQFFLNKGSDYVDAINEGAGKYDVRYSANQGRVPTILGGIKQGDDGPISVQMPAAQYYTDMYNQMKPKTLDWIAGPSGGNSCHYYGTCSQQAAGSSTPLTSSGTQIQQGDGRGAMLTPGQPNPIMTGNSVFNQPANYEAMGYELLPSGTTDFKPGDMIRKNFSPTAGQGMQHSIVASGYVDEDNNPLTFDNSGGRPYAGMQLGDNFNPSEYYNYDPENTEGGTPMRVMRYVGDMPAYQGIQNYMQNYMQTLYPDQYAQAYAPPPQVIMDPETMQEGVVTRDNTMVNMPNINKLNLPTVNKSDINLEQLMSGMKNGGKVPSYGPGGMLNFKDNYWNSQNRYDRLEDRADKYNIDLLQTDGTAKTNRELASDTRNARNAAFAGSGVGQAAGAFSSVAPQISGMILSGGTPGDYEPGRAKAAGAVSGVGTGLQLGMNFGPIGAAVGAVLGGIGGAIFGGSQAKKAEDERKENKENMLASNIASGKTQNEVRSAGILGQYDTEGVTSSYYAKYGGFMGQPDYTVEGGELMMAPNNNPPQTDNNGRVTQIGKNMFKFEGDTHDAPSGGIGVQGGNSEFASQTNQVLDSGFVFSDRLKADPNDYLKNI